jgi:hypothetical protein
MRGVGITGPNPERGLLTSKSPKEVNNCDPVPVLVSEVLFPERQLYIQAAYRGSGPR